MEILLTGASGFVGQALLPRLAGVEESRVTATSRSDCQVPDGVSFVRQDLADSEELADMLAGKQVVIHTAARAHIMQDDAADRLAEYRKVNVQATLNLARQAAAAGVNRFIFISSVKVNGETTTGRSPFVETDLPTPEDPYGISKLEAELALRELSQETGMEIVIIRPPLVYGAGVKANFRSLMALSAKRLPLPFRMVRNARSMIYVGNLIDFVICCIEHPAAANQTFLVSDGDDLSLSGLISRIRTVMGRPAWLLPIPVLLFRLAGVATGKRSVVDRLVGDLQVDSTKARKLLGWTPPFSVQQGIETTVADFIARK